MSEGAGMGEIVRTVARLLRPLILVYGAYLVLYGHLSPGGGFAGGVVIASGFVLVAIADGRREALGLFSRRAAASLDSAGVLLFLALATMGAWWAGEAFFSNFIATPEARRFTLVSGGIIPLANIGLGVKVASSLFLVFVALDAFEPGAGDDDGPGDAP